MSQKKIINPILLRVQNVRVHRSSGYYSSPRQSRISMRYLTYGHVREDTLGYRICLKRK